MTRVTQSMLSTNMLRNLNTSYGKMSKYQEMLNTGMKITRASDDPVVAVKGMGYRTQLGKVEQFQRNINEANSWLDTTDEALGQVGEVLNRLKELIVQASNDTNTTEERQKVKSEIDQIREQIQDVANTQLNGKYIFSGTNTQKPLFVETNGQRALNTAVGPVDATDPTQGYYNENGQIIFDPLTAASGEVKIEVFDGIQLTVNIQKGSEIFAKVDSVLNEISTVLGDPSKTGEDVTGFLGSIANGGNTITDLQALVLEARADVGAKQNRVEMMENRLKIHEINVTKQKSNNEDTDYAKTITDMVTQESIHQAALSVGAKVIQQTLVDFIR